MKRFIFPVGRLLVVAFSLFLLSSCYFNSAGHIFDKASHQEAVFTVDLKVGQPIYQQGENYYLEFLRHRYDVPVVTQYSIASQEQSENELEILTGKMIMMHVQADFAKYLMGQGEGPTKSSFYKQVEDAESIKLNSTQHQVVRVPAETSVHVYKYVSPNAFGWYTLGVFDWLCVDLPITCVENGVVAACVFASGYAAAEEARREAAPPPPAPRPHPHKPKPPRR